jgi:hypothetical protein
MELIQGMRNKEELNLLNKMIREWEIDVILVDENINSKAISHSLIILFKRFNSSLFLIP